MKNSQADIQKPLDVIAGILIRCFLGGMVLLAVWFAWFAVAGDWIYQVHTRWFQIPRQTFDAIHYAGMAVTKICDHPLFPASLDRHQAYVREKGRIRKEVQGDSLWTSPDKPARMGCGEDSCPTPEFLFHWSLTTISLSPPAPFASVLFVQDLSLAGQAGIA